MKHILYSFILLFSVFLSCDVQNKGMSKPSSNYSISPAATTLLDVIVGKFPGVKVIGYNVGNSNPKILIRGGSLSINNQAYAIYDIDGSIQTEFPSYIDPNQVINISILGRETDFRHMSPVCHQAFIFQTLTFVKTHK